jgi:hypothetical protein
VLYEEHNLYNIRDIKRTPYREYPPIDTEFSNITRKARVKYGTDYIRLYDEMLFCSDEVMYFTANLFLYRQFLNNPLDDAEKFGSGMVYPNLGTFHSKRYAMFANAVGEKLYNLWDRLGDLLASFFPDFFDQNRVFFADTIQKLPAEYRTGENYQWLLNFSRNQYVQLNKIRKQTVHHFGVANIERHEHLLIFRDRDAIEEWQGQRLHWPDFYNEHIAYTLVGFQKMLHLLQEISTVLFSDVP